MPQPVECISQATLGGFRKGSGGVCDFLKTQSRLGAKQKGFTLENWKRRDRGKQRRAEGIVVCTPLGIISAGSFEYIHFLGNQLCLRKTPPLSPPIHRAAAGNGKQVSNEARFRQISLAPLYDGGPGFLRDLLDVPGLRCHALHEAKQRRSMFLVKQPECSLAASLKIPHQRLIR